MFLPSRLFAHAFFAVTGLTALLLLAGIIVLPGLGNWMDLAQAQTEPATEAALAFSHNTWTSVAAMPVALEAPMAGVIKTKKPKTNWTNESSMPQALIWPHFAVDKNARYCFGGGDNNGQFRGSVFNNVQIYHP